MKRLGKGRNVILGIVCILLGSALGAVAYADHAHDPGSTAIKLGPIGSTIFYDETFDPSADPAIVNKVEVFGQLLDFTGFNLCDLARERPVETITSVLGLEGQNVQISQTPVNNHAWQISSDDLTHFRVPVGMLYFDGNAGVDWKLDAEFQYQPFALRPTADRLVFWTCVSRDNPVYQDDREHAPSTSCVRGAQYLAEITNSSVDNWSAWDWNVWHFESSVGNPLLVPDAGIYDVDGNVLRSDSFTDAWVVCQG